MEENKKLSEEVFETALDYLPRLIGGLEKASRHFKAEENVAGLQILNEAGDGLTWFNQVVQGLPVLLPQGENAADIQEHWRPYLDALKNTLTHLEKLNPPAIAAALDSEIVPFLRMFHEKIGNLQSTNNYPQ